MGIQTDTQKNRDREIDKWRDGQRATRSTTQTCCLYLFLCGHMSVLEELLKEVLSIVFPEVCIGIMGGAVHLCLLNGRLHPRQNLLSLV